MLKTTFFNLISAFSNDVSLREVYWAEITQNYSSKNRHYHTLHHLENLFMQLLPVKTEVEDWYAILFSLFYHDLKYNVLRSDNEEKSAKWAVKRMHQLSVPLEIINRTEHTILATKSHTCSSENDVNFFTDADLSILGQDWKMYESYYQNVRKEYSVYPDLVYKKGRRKVLEHFLAMKRIYKTDYFYHLLEKKAKENILRELELLS